MLGDLFNWSLFKTDEEKRKEYEDNIAANIAAMEVQDRANRRTAYSNDPTFLQTPIEKRNILNTGNYHYLGLGGNISPIAGPFSVKRETTPENAAEVREAYKKYNQELLNPIYDIIPWGNTVKPLPVDINSVKVPPKNIAEEINKLTAKPWTPAIQKQIDVLQQGGALSSNISKIYDLSKEGKGGFKTPGKVIADATVGSNSLLNLLPFLVAASQQKTQTTPSPLPQAVVNTGLLRDDDDLYSRYRRV